MSPGSRAHPTLCEDLQLICTQQSLLLLPSAPALHMQTALPRAELGACPQLAGLCLCMTPSSQSLGLSMRQETHNCPPMTTISHHRKGEILTLTLKARWILRHCYALAGSGSILLWLGTGSIQHITKSTA